MTETDEIVKPTPERLRKARQPAVRANGKLLTAANDNFDRDKLTGSTRMQDAPVERLLRTGALTVLQHTAASRYYADWYAAGLAPLGAFDYARPIVDGKSPMGDSDYRVAASVRWNQARGELGLRLAQVVDPVVLAEISLEEAGRSLGHNNRPQAVAVALDRLIGGLDVLVKRYGLETK